MGCGCNVGGPDSDNNNHGMGSEYNGSGIDRHQWMECAERTESAKTDTNTWGSHSGADTKARNDDGTDAKSLWAIDVKTDWPAESANIRSTALGTRPPIGRTESRPLSSTTAIKGAQSGTFSSTTTPFTIARAVTWQPTTVN